MLLPAEVYLYMGIGYLPVPESQKEEKERVLEIVKRHFAMETYMEREGHYPERFDRKFSQIYTGVYYPRQAKRFYSSTEMLFYEKKMLSTSIKDIRKNIEQKYELKDRLSDIERDVLTFLWSGENSHYTGRLLEAILRHYIRKFNHLPDRILESVKWLLEKCGVVCKDIVNAMYNVIIFAVKMELDAKGIYSLLYNFLKGKKGEWGQSLIQELDIVAPFIGVSKYNEEHLSVMNNLLIQKIKHGKISEARDLVEKSISLLRKRGMIPYTEKKEVMERNIRYFLAKENTEIAKWFRLLVSLYNIALFKVLFQNDNSFIEVFFSYSENTIDFYKNSKKLAEYLPRIIELCYSLLAGYVASAIFQEGILDKIRQCDNFRKTVEKWEKKTKNRGYLSSKAQLFANIAIVMARMGHEKETEYTINKLKDIVKESGNTKLLEDALYNAILGLSLHEKEKEAKKYLSQLEKMRSLRAITAKHIIYKKKDTEELLV